MNFSCSICMELFGTNCAIATIPCGHVFHEACIKRWHSAEKNCSLCRKKCKAEEISKLYLSESESSIKSTDICTEYERKIHNLNKEIHGLKVDKQKVNFSELNLKNLRLKEENLRLQLGWNEWEKKYLTLNETLLESQEDNTKLSEKLQDRNFQIIMGDYGSLCTSIGTIKCLLCGGDKIYPGPRYQNHLIHDHGVVHDVEYLIKSSIHKREHKGQLPNFFDQSLQEFANKEESESASKNTDICTKYDRKILNLKKEIHDLKVIKRKVKFGELNLENLRFKDEIEKLKVELNEWERKYLILNETLLESQEDNNKLTEKLKDLKCHEKHTQNRLRNEINMAYSKVSDIRSNLKMKIEEIEKAKREIVKLEAKLATSSLCLLCPPRWNSKRKQQQLQDKSATIKSPPKKKMKEQLVADSNVPVSTHTT